MSFNESDLSSSSFKEGSDEYNDDDEYITSRDGTKCWKAPPSFVTKNFVTKYFACSSWTH